MMITVIGRGHSGTRAMSHTLSASGVYMGAKLNVSGDLVPADDLYQACRIMGRHVIHKGGVEWDFSKLHTMPIDPAFVRLVESYLGSVIESNAPRKGWKLPETTLILPWIVRMFPDTYYIYWTRDPRDSILGAHLTDDLADFGVPYEETDDPYRRRAISWQYQYEIMRATPAPVHRLNVRFEDFVFRQGPTLSRIADFLGFPVEKVEVRPESVGRWRTADQELDFPFFPRSAFYTSDSSPERN